MNRDETRELLALVAACDPRWQPTGVDVDAWSLILADCTTLEDAKRAVAEHHRDSPHRITPSDVHRRAKALRLERSERHAIPAPQGVPKPPGWPGPEVLARIQAGAAKHRAVSPSFATAMGELAAMGPAPKPTPDAPPGAPADPMTTPARGDDTHE